MDELYRSKMFRENNSSSFVANHESSMTANLKSSVNIGSLQRNPSLSKCNLAAQMHAKASRDGLTAEISASETIAWYIA